MKIQQKDDGINLQIKNSFGDACTPQPREIVRKVNQYKGQETFRVNSVSFVKVQIIFKKRK